MCDVGGFGYSENKSGMIGIIYITCIYITKRIHIYIYIYIYIYPGLMMHLTGAL